MITEKGVLLELQETAATVPTASGPIVTMRGPLDEFT
jgi:hypothetical protein